MRLRRFQLGLLLVIAFMLSFKGVWGITFAREWKGGRAPLGQDIKVGMAVEGPSNSDGDIFPEVVFLSISDGRLIANVEEVVDITKITWRISLWNDVEFGDIAVGDFNGDGYSDIAVSNPTYDTSGCTDVGMIEIYYGGAGGPGSAGSSTLLPGDTSIAPPAQNGLLFGWSMDAVDGGDYDYLLVGAPGLTIDSYNSGYAALYNLKNGQKLWDTGLTQALYPGHNTGVCVRDLSGLYGDNVVCFGVSNYYYATPLWNDPSIAGYFGIVWIIYKQGTEWASTSVSGTIKEDPWNKITPTQFGSSFSAGDFNGDGYKDLLVGEPRTSSSVSTVYIYQGSAEGLITAGPVVSIPQQGGIDFGIEVATIGDINNDGCDDFLVGAPLYDYGGVTDNGRVYLYQGGPFAQIPSNNIWNLYGDTDPYKGTNQYLGGAREPFPKSVGGGKSLWGMTSINGDGKDDFLIGSPYIDDPYNGTGIPDVGYVRLYYG